jgi:hypothetical protein
MQKHQKQVFCAIVANHPRVTLCTLEVQRREKPRQAKRCSSPCWRPSSSAARTHNRGNHQSRRRENLVRMEARTNTTFCCTELGSIVLRGRENKII